MAQLHYTDGEPVELGDIVWFHADDIELEGHIAEYYPRKRTVKVRYLDPTHRTKSGSAKLRVKTLAVSETDLARRDC